MAADEQNKIVVTEQDGAIDSILQYLKERIESPFLMSFLFSWVVINRDFVFYLFLSNDRNKHYELANWDFSAFVFNVGEFSWHSTWADSFWYPLFFGILMALLFSPVSMFLSGCRYFILAKVASFTQSNKQGFDTAYNIKLIERNLKKLDEEVTESKKLKRELEKDIERYSREAVSINENIFSSKLGLITPFLIESAKFAIKNNKENLNEGQKHGSNILKPNALIEVDITYIAQDPTNPYKSDDSQNYTGNVFDFFTDGNYFKLDNQDDLETIKIIIDTMEVDKEISCKINGKKAAIITLKKSMICIA